MRSYVFAEALKLEVKKKVGGADLEFSSVGTSQYFHGVTKLITKTKNTSLEADRREPFLIDSLMINMSLK